MWNPLITYVQSISIAVVPEDIGTAGALRAISHYLTTKDILVVSGDLVSDVSLGAIAATHRRHDAVVTATLCSVPISRSSELGSSGGKDKTKKPGRYNIIGLDPCKQFLLHIAIGKMPRRRLRDLSIVQNTTNSEEVLNSRQLLDLQAYRRHLTTENGGTRRGRGRTLLTDLYNLNSVEHVKVTRNSHGQPVGQEARLLAGYLGIIARNANMLPINYESWHNMPDNNKNQALSNIKETSSGQKVGRLQLFDITHRKKDGTPMTSEAAKIMEKLKDKKAEYEATASTDSSVNFEDIDNRIINEVLGPERSQSQAEVQRLKDQIVQIQASTDEQISQLKAEAAAREAEQNRKYNELQPQLQSMMTMFQQFQNPPS
ncbi:hypothetical protein GOBAR_AA20575 [Gossypium barbadense]|uniref:Translation initiation factor eIF2B subunit gamma n=1 Tax=Gossypium barbadense TaxID=3634 RepID=A0A2P5X9U5_GOSBA|nr:hypothetical protein GOBAR_AA20575 [Gossypium barbadense]